jgi:16S rRNA C967 or C1407 C5-methylase (RsmB/RsmF family)
MQWALDNLPVRLTKVSLQIGDPGLTSVFGKKLHPDIANCRRFWPHKTMTQGFFIAKLVRV